MTQRVEQRFLCDLFISYHLLQLFGQPSRGFKRFVRRMFPCTSPLGYSLRCSCFTDGHTTVLHMLPERELLLCRTNSCYLNERRFRNGGRPPFFLNPLREGCKHEQFADRATRFANYFADLILRVAVFLH